MMPRGASLWDGCTPDSLENKAFRRIETLFIQGRILVQNVFTIYIVKEINACLLTNLFVLNKNSTLDE